MSLLGLPSLLESLLQIIGMLSICTIGHFYLYWMQYECTLPSIPVSQCSPFPSIHYIYRQLKDAQQPEPVLEPVVVVVVPLEPATTFCNFIPMIHPVYKWDLLLC